MQTVRSIPIEQAMPNLAPYRGQHICGLLRIGPCWFTFWEGELSTTGHATRLAAIDALRALELNVVRHV